MTDALEKAEEHLKQAEAAGLTYSTPEDRGQAKLALAEQFTKQAKQEQIPASAAAIESGGVVGATPGQGDDAEAITARIDSLRQGPATQEKMKERAKLTKQLCALLDESDITVQITR